MSQRIFVSLDGSTLSETILPQAVALAHVTGSGLTLVRVVPSLLSAGYSAVAIIPDNWYEEEVAWTRDYLEKIAQRLRGEGLEVNTEVLDGEPASAILAYIEEQPEIELIAMATHGRGGISRWVIGSVATKVMQVAAKPVVLLHSHKDGGASAHAVSYHTVIVPLDGTVQGERVLELAQKVATVSGAIMVLVLIAQGHDEGRLQMGKSSDYLEQKAHQLRAAGLTVQTEVSSGDPAALLEQLCQSGKCDVLVMATHRKRSEGVIMKFIHHVDIPVLLVPEHEAQAHRHR